MAALIVVVQAASNAAQSVVNIQFRLLSRSSAVSRAMAAPLQPASNVPMTAPRHIRAGTYVIRPIVMSNHHHTVIYDRHGTIVEFTEHLHATSTRINAIS